MSNTDSIVAIRGTRHVVSDCITCGILYTVPERMWNEQRKFGGYHHCPNGHRQGWSKTESENAKIRRERDRLTQQLAERDDAIAREQSRRKIAERSSAAYKGQVTKLRKRAKAGMCPCCNRHFNNVDRHMKSQHPDFEASAPDNVVELKANA